jgi:heat shock protein HslJ
MENLMKKIVVSLFILLILAACAGGKSASVEGTWRLVSYGSATEQTPAAADIDTSIEFKDGQVGGNVGCNGFGGKYEVEGEAITFSEVVSTLMFCEGPAGDQELATLAVLRQTATYVLDGDTLTLTAADGTAMIVLARK